jgi:chitin synthase
MDDFSWGQTRLVLGESGKKMIVHDEGKFDPRSIPLKSWNDYENELWDKESNHSIGSWVPPVKTKNDGYAESRTASLYGRETYYEPRSFSPAPSQMGILPPPGYQSGRNTPSSPFYGGLESGLLQPTPSRPITNYLDVNIPRGQSPDAGHPINGPSDVDIDRAVNDVLRTADLNSVTKRGIRRQLEEQFQMDLTSRKASINAAIDRALLNQN